MCEGMLTRSSHGFRRSIIFALFFLFIGSTGVSNYIKSCLTTENVFWSDFLVRKVATSTKKTGFAIWFRPTSRYGFFTAHRTNNRADSSPCKLFSSWQLRHIATIFSSAKVGIFACERKLSVANTLVCITQIHLRHFTAFWRVTWCLN